MGSDKAKIKAGYSHLTENWEVPDFQNDIRLRRRWKRRCIANEMMKHNYSANATRKNVWNCGNAAVKTTENSGHGMEEEVDMDYKFFLDNVVSRIDIVSDNNIGGSDIDVNTSHGSNSDDDTDDQYKMFFENLREERLHDSVNSEVHCDSVDEDYQLFLNSSRIEGDSLVYMPERAITIKYGGSESEEKSSKVRQNLQVPNEATESPNTGQGSDDYHVAKHKCNSEVLRDIVDEDYRVFPNSVVRQNSEGKSSMVRQNLQVPNEATEPPYTGQGSDVYHVAKHRCNSEVLSDIVDEDYQLFLNSVCIVGDNLTYMPENGVTEVYEEEYDQSSTDSEPIVLDPIQYYENSPFICSKSYHSSWLADERNHKDSMLFHAFDPSPYRKGLMEELERPYDQKEYDKLLQEASCRRAKERHRETRHGMIKSCPLRGFNKSNLEMYSDLAKAIDQVKEPHKVLFLLRGFFYWLKHVPQVGAFQPWLDASCLEILQKL